MENEKMTAKELYEAMIEGKLEYTIDYSVLKKKKKKKEKNNMKRIENRIRMNCLITEIFTYYLTTKYIIIG